MEKLTDTFSSAPDVSPDDVWDDAACLVPDGQGAAVILPPKRVKPDNSSGNTAGFDPNEGFRIGSRAPAQAIGEAMSKLEVQEIDGTVVRLQPEEPSVPRMPRHLVFHERPVNEDEVKKTGEAREWGHSKKQPVFWILGTGMAVAALVIGAISLLPLINKSNAERPRPDESEWVVEAITNADKLNDMLARQTEAERVFREFLNAPSVDAVLPLMRDPEQVASLIQASRNPWAAPASPQSPKIFAWGARENQSLTYGILSGTLPDFSEFEAYFTISNGRLVMDWKATAAYGSADFAQLAAKQGDPSEIRGCIETTDYYTLAFPENDFQAYQLSSPDKQQVLWVYARRDSTIHETLKIMVKGGYILEGRRAPQKVTVRLEPGPAESLPNQWLVVELLHKNWIAP
jgi:hypothetical protein